MLQYSIKVIHQAKAVALAKTKPWSKGVALWRWVEGFPEDPAAFQPEGSIPIAHLNTGEGEYWLYFLFHHDQLVYVGQTTQGYGRIINHEKEFDAMHVMRLPSYDIMMWLELFAINYYAPPLNARISQELARQIDRGRLTLKMRRLIVPVISQRWGFRAVRSILGADVYAEAQTEGWL